MASSSSPDRGVAHNASSTTVAECPQPGSWRVVPAAMGVWPIAVGSHAVSHSCGCGGRLKVKNIDLKDVAGSTSSRAQFVVAFLQMSARKTPVGFFNVSKNLQVFVQIYIFYKYQLYKYLVQKHISYIKCIRLYRQMFDFIQEEMQSLFTFFTYKYIYTILKLCYRRCLISSSSLYYFNQSYFDKDRQED